MVPSVDAGRPWLVIGGSGMLGGAVLDELSARGLAAAAPTRDRFDLEMPDGLAAEIARLAPRAVLNLAAFNDVVGAELPARRDELFRLNRDAPAALARACAAAEIPLVHISTDYVFDGTGTRPYLEDAPTGPLQAYGRSKLEGERQVLGADPRALVVRTSTLYGPGRRGRPHYVDAVLKQAVAGGDLEVVRQPVSSPTYTRDLAIGLLALLEAGVSGVVHFTNAGQCSRLELTIEVMRQSGLPVSVREKPEPSGSLRRPAYSVLDCSRYEKLTGRSRRAWQAALGDYLAETAR